MSKKRGEKSCGAILVTEEGKFLLIQHLAGHWDFPKGHVEKDETEKETALREVKEETGLDVEIIDGFRESLNYLIQGVTPKEVVFFVAKIISRDVKIQEEEIKNYIVLDEEEAVKKITYSANVQLFKKAVSFLKEKGIIKSL